MGEADIGGQMQTRVLWGRCSGGTGAPGRRGRQGYAQAVILAMLLALAGFVLQAVPQTVHAANPPQYTISTGDGSMQSAQINHAYSTQLSAAVVQSGNFAQTVPGIAVTFTAPATGASGTFAATGTNTTTVTTNGTGLATASVLTANGTAGPFTVTASAPNATSNFFFETNTATNTTGQPAVLSIGDGSSQAAQINTAFSTRLSAAVFDGSGNYVQGAVVTFTAPATGASGTFADTHTAVTTATTSSTGLATASVFTANGTAGQYFVEVMVGTLNNSFALKNTLYNPNGVPDTISTSDGGNQQTKIDTTFAKAIQVVVLDGSGNYVQNITVTFTVVAGNTGAGGTFANGTTTTTAPTGSTGLATSSALTANHAAGNFTVMVTAGQVSTNVSETNLAIDTTTKLASTANPSVVGQSVTLTATVTPASGNGTPGGTVVFKDNGGVIAGCGSVTLNAAQATCTPASLSLGTHPLTVEYSGDAAYNPSTGSLSQVVNQASTTTGLTSSLNPSTVGQSVMFTATVSVTAPGGGTPTGMVTFKDNGATIGTGTLMNGQATYSTSALSAATHPITAVYGSDSNFTGSTSSAVNQDVRNPAPAITTISPAAAVTHASATTVTITGTGFVSTSAVHFGADTLVTTYVSPTQLTAVIPTADLGIVGSVTVTVVNPTPGGGSSNAVTFTVEPGPPASLIPIPATPQDVPVTTTISLSVTVKDSFGNVVADGTTVTFSATTVSGATASLPNSGATTTTNGVATITATANTTAAGSYTVTATANGQSATFTLTNTPGPPAHLTASAGASQHATVGTAFGSALQATVTDASSNPVPGVTVTFTATTATTGASATLSNGGTATTGANGQASVTATANTHAGGYTVMASASGIGSPATFTLTNDPGAPATLAANAGTTPQSTTVNTTFTVPLAVTLTDHDGNPISGVTVTFTAPASGASGVFTGSGNTATAPTNAQGVATAPSITANSTAGGYSVAASGGGVTNATAFALTNLAGAPSRIVVTAGGGQHATVGTAFGTALAATVTDASGNVVPNATVTFTAPTTGATATFPGGATATATTNAQGVATVPTLTAGTTAGAFTVTASAPGTGTPATFALTNDPGAPASVTATAGTPQSAPVTTTFPVALAVRVADQHGNAVPNVTVTFTAPTTGASGTFAGGGTNVTIPTPAQGVAIAPAFTANDTVGGYTVTATVSGVGTAGRFSLTNTAAALQSITLSTPANLGSPPSVKVGQTVAFTAMGTYADGSTQNLSSQVQWSSDTAGVVTVDAAGKVTGESPGTGTITATLNGVTQRVVVTVAGPTPVGIIVAPAPAARPSGATGQPGAPAPAPVPRSSGGAAAPAAATSGSPPAPIPAGR